MSETRDVQQVIGNETRMPQIELRGESVCNSLTNFPLKNLSFFPPIIDLKRSLRASDGFGNVMPCSYHSKTNLSFSA